MLRKRRRDLGNLKKINYRDGGDRGAGRRMP